MSIPEHDDQRGVFPIGDGPVPVGPGAPSPGPVRLDFGHYAGRSIEELVEVDPDYLHWLARHPSGARYRAEIGRVLGSPLRSTEY